MGFPVTVVLGTSGRIGRVLRHFWPRIAPLTGAETGAEIRWQSRSPLPPQPEGSEPVFLDPLADPQGLAQLCTGAEAVLCLAGSIPGRGTDLADNSRLACAAVQAAARAAEISGAPAARVLLCSSAAVYGSQPGLLSEDSPLRPANAYGSAKAEMEHQALALGRQLGVPVTALRIGNIAGLDACLGGWTPGFTLDQFADHRSPRRSYIGPATLARVLAALLACPQLPAVLNLAQPGALEMAALLRAAGHSFAWRPAPATAIAEVELDLHRLRHVLQGGALISALDAADAAQMVEEWSELEPIMPPKSPLPNDPSPDKEKPSR
ncbi:NAD(P)-dependent oxidoreductase [Pseudophaeobacter sp.]|uniref:NAD-dependent epimerase/dehydratase family protein n=1 Tax=Pseudophaeobacter sp. TaxID=1971739 RepID=UPI003299E334